MPNIRVVPIQQLCIVCGEEKPERIVTQGLASRLCGECIRLIQEKVISRELEQHPKIVRV